MSLVQSLFCLFELRQAFCVLSAAIFLYFAAAACTAHQKLQHVPGPRLASWTELWLLKVAWRGNFHLVADRLFREFGSPVRIGPNLIISDDPEIIRYMTAPRSKFRRGHWYKGMRLDAKLNNTLSEQDEQRHSELRTKLLPGYTGRDVPSLESRVDARVEDLIAVLGRYADNGDVVDFAHLAQYLALDVLTDIAFGSPFGFLTEEEDLFSYIKKSCNFLPLMEIGTMHPWIHRMLSSKLMARLAGPKPTDKTGLGAIIGVAQKVIDDRFQRPSSPGRRRDMLDSFMERGLTQREAESESLLQVLAGADSAATCIRMTLLFLLTNPSTYARLREEVRKAMDVNRISTPVVRNQEAMDLPYLQACIKESLRLWVPLNGLNTKVAPAEGVCIDGVTIPGGTQVAHAHYAMMRRQDIFGKDAGVFRPDRWLGRPSDALKRQEKVWELSFSYGRFACLGRPIAMMELNKVFVELFRRFDFGLVDPVKPISTRCHQIHIQEGMYVTVSRSVGPKTAASWQ